MSEDNPTEGGGFVVRTNELIVYSIVFIDYG